MDIAPSTPADREPDNLLGICHALGHAFGIDPLYLRLAVLAAMLADFQIAAIVYLLAGVALALAALVDRAADRLRRRSSAAA